MTRLLETATLSVQPAAIRAYAELTQDFNPIHLDPAFAAATPMRGVIAHGTMSICLLWKALFRSFGAGAFHELELDIRFVRPVRVGETLTAGGRQSADDPRSYEVWVRAEDGEDRLAGSVRLAAGPG
jgi:3-hydroxybutyryl-CoA dehydratase